MRQRILGGLGVVWGGLILLRQVLGGPPPGEGAYAAGHTTGLVIGALLFVVGLHYLLRKPAVK